MKIKLPRHQINELASIHGKMMLVDFDTPKEAITHSREGKVIDDVIAENTKLRESVVKKFKIDEKTDGAVLQKANVELTKILLEEVELELSMYKEQYINQIKTSPREAMVLDSTGLFKFE